MLFQKSRTAQSCVDRRGNAVSLIKPKIYVICIAAIHLIVFEPRPKQHVVDFSYPFGDQALFDAPESLLKGDTAHLYCTLFIVHF